MRISEILKEDMEENKMPHLYLDMDGVQADFFGAWSKRSGVEHWKAIADKEKEINELAHSTPEEVYEFFRDLGPLSGGMEVISWLRKNKIPYTVLSAPLRGPYSQASIKAKRDWLDEFHPGSSSDAIFTQNKHTYAKTDGVPNVLVDDFGKYLNAWSGAGGIAVKHEDQYEDPDTGSNTIAKLEKIYKPYLNI
jgi:5'(3')-deoxyribonucleotidase